MKSNLEKATIWLVLSGCHGRVARVHVAMPVAAQNRSNAAEGGPA